jgi:hypothetical protein
MRGEPVQFAWRGRGVTPADLDVHLVLDNASTHETPR